MAKEVSIVATGAARGSRIDVFLAGEDLGPSLSRSRIQSLIRQGLITLDGKPVKAHHKLSGGEEVRVIVPEPRPLEILPADIPVPILYEDEDLVVVVKPAGLVVHPAPGNLDNTLVNALLHHCRDLSGIGGVERPGIVHRLDKDTSGVMVAVKNDAAHHSLSAQLKARSVRKVYAALVRGGFTEDSGSIAAPIGRHERHRKKMTVHTRRSREAKTSFEVIERFEGYSLLEVLLGTGRTHQIRVHLSHIGHPVVGDPVYGGRGARSVNCRGEEKKVPRQMLHSRLLGFVHPRSGDYMEFEAAMPEDMEEAIDFLRDGPNAPGGRT